MELEQLETYSINEILKDEKLIFAVRDLYKKYSGEHLCISCPGAIQSVYYWLRQYNQTNHKNKTNMKNLLSEKFILKAGVVLHDYQNSTDYRRETITDEQAEDLLKRTPSAIKHFEKYPEEFVVENSLHVTNGDAGGDAGAGEGNNNSAGEGSGGDGADAGAGDAGAGDGAEKQSEKKKEDGFDEMTIDDLVDFANTAQYPKAEFKAFKSDKNAMIEYLRNKNAAK